MRRPKKKNWPTSWKQPRAVVTLKGGSFERDLIVLPFTVEASTPAQLEERVDDAIVERAKVQRPS